MPNADGTPTDAERIALYEKCQNGIPFNFAGLANFAAGIFAGDPSAILQPFLDGYGQKGCDVFLTQAQIDARDLAGWEERRAQGGNVIGGGGH